jgi:hypothetical protein
MEFELRGHRYVAAPAGREELPALNEFCTRIVPGGFAGLDKWLERYERNPGMFYAVRDEDAARDGAGPVGGFVVTPLVAEACELLDRGLLKGIDLKVEQIAPPGETPAAIYLSGIAAEGREGRAATLELMRDVIRRAVAGGTRLLYARPMRGAGLRLIRKYGFEPIDPAAPGPFDHIYRKEFAAADPAPRHL